MKYYKAFNKGMVCRGKQYEVGKEYEENGGGICNAGMMHFCETPFDTLDYYPLIDSDGNFSEFAEVEPLDEIVKDGNKCASKKIRIGAKLSFKDFIKAGVDILIEKTKPEKVKNETGLTDNGGDGAKIGSSGDRAQIGSSGDRAQIGSSGDGAQIGSSGYGAQIGSSGYGAQIKMTGERSVASAIGYNCQISGKKGDWIVLAEWKQDDNDNWYPAYVKSGQIDGEALKEDTMYTLKDGKFVEAQEAVDY